MSAGLAILALWLAGLCTFVGGFAFHARLQGVRLLTRQFLAELLVLAAFLSLVLYGPALLGLDHTPR